MMAKIVAANGAHPSAVAKTMCVQCHVLKGKRDHTPVQVVDFPSSNRIFVILRFMVASNIECCGMSLGVG